jgi:drug/metabolite transporter (DMT)-like permease
MHLKLSESRLPFASLLLIAPFFLWGTAMVAMKGVIPNTTPLFMAGVRLVPAGFLVLIAAMWMGRSQPIGWKAWLWIALFALVDGTMFQGFLAEGLARTGAGLGSVMIDSQPLAVALLALWLFGERIGFWGWLGLLSGVLGISLLGLPDEWILGLLHNVGVGLQGMWAGMTGTTAQTVVLNFEPGFPNGEQLLTRLFQSGEWLMLLAALSMAVGTVMMRAVCRYADPVAATGWHMVLGGVPLFVASAWQETSSWQHLTVGNWMSLSYATVFGSAIAYGLFFYFAASGSLTSLSSLTFLTPVFALLFGNLLLSEVLTPVQWSGVGLTLVSIYLINQRDVLQARFQRETATPIAQSGTVEVEGSLQSASNEPFREIATVQAGESESELLP